MLQSSFNMKSGTNIVNYEQIGEFKEKFDFEPSFLTIDGTEIKIIVRSNPGLVLLQNATITDKWPSRSIPTFEYIQTEYLK